MTGQVLAALLLALAVLVRPGRAAVAARLAALGPTVTTPAPRWRWPALRSSTPRSPTLRIPLLAAAGSGTLALLVGGPSGLLAGPVIGVAVFFGCRLVLRRAPPRRSRAPDPLALASGWDLLAACLRGGMPVPAAVHAIAGHLPAETVEAAEALRRTAELIALGADPEAAWAPALAQPLTAELARGARRSARSGAALAAVAEGLATTVRANADDLAEASAQRASVAVAGPLALCFLPAFLCVGVVPVVIGLASRLFNTW
jgi:pilus assembly protein TadC